MPDVRTRRQQAPSQLVDRLESIHDWYEGMVSGDTGRLVYEYDPVDDESVANGHPIRNIAAIRDVERLSRFLERDDLRPVVERSLEHFSEYIIPHRDGLILDSDGLGEPSNIAHSAFMVLALSGSDAPARKSTVAGLARALMDQQREDGSYEVFFGERPDEGVEFYPGELMLALMRSYEISGDPEQLISVERGFRFYQDRFRPDDISNRLRIFYANWQSQYGVRLHELTDADVLRDEVRDYLFDLHDEIVKSGFYEQIDARPHDQSTVEVASAVEGLSEAYTVAARENDQDQRQNLYGECLRTALSWLFDAQRTDTDHPRERGGFGYSLDDRTQRIDITGHAMSGLIKCAENDIEPSRPS